MLLLEAKCALADLPVHGNTGQQSQPFAQQVKRDAGEHCKSFVARAVKKTKPNSWEHKNGCYLTEMLEWRLSIHVECGAALVDVSQEGSPCVGSVV